ncbi:hypothetical protein R6Q59_023976 [Mikania micrantha]
MVYGEDGLWKGLRGFTNSKTGDGSGYMRFEDAEGAQKACVAGMTTEEGGLRVKNYVVILDPVIGVLQL